MSAGDGHTDRVVKVRMSNKLAARREVAKMEGRYPRGTKGDAAEAARDEALLGPHHRSAGANPSASRGTISPP